MGFTEASLQIELTESIAGFIAICMSVARLWIRRDRYWWDDAWAFFSMLNLFIQSAAVAMHAHTGRHKAHLSKTNRVASYYLMACTFYTIIWSARISILFSIIRIDSDAEARRKLVWLAGVFVAAIAFFIAQLLWTCEPIAIWKDHPTPQCKLNKSVAICQLVSDVIADTLLITLPLRLIQGVKDKRLRRRVMFIFSTSIVTTIVSLVHAAFIITSGGGTDVLIAAFVEDCMSLTVANVPVVGSAAVRLLCANRKSVREEGDLDDGPNWSPFRRLTGQWARRASISGALPYPHAAVHESALNVTTLTSTGRIEQIPKTQTTVCRQDIGLSRSFIRSS